MKLSAVLFDVDGTIAETEEYHRKSFNESFKEFNLDWFWDEAIYKELINVGGGKERIMYHIKRAWPEMLNYKNLSKYIDSIHKIKNEIFEDFMKDMVIKPRKGVIRLINELKERKIRLAIVSSSSESNILNLFNNALKININEKFDIIAHGDITKNKKPSPEIYEWTLEKMRLPPQSCLAIEDSPRGMESALRANINVVVTPSILTSGEKFDGAKLVVSDLGEFDEPFQKISGEDFGYEYVCYDMLQKINES